jgi:hypothetical protein
MNRLYANETVYTCDDPQLVFPTRILKEEIAKSDEEWYKKFYQEVCDNVRKSLGITNVLGLAINKELTEITIFVYEMTATAGIYFVQKVDEELGTRYLEI